MAHDLDEDPHGGDKAVSTAIVAQNEFTAFDLADTAGDESGDIMLNQALVHEVRGKKQLSAVGVRFIVQKLADKGFSQRIDERKCELHKIDPDDKEYWVWEAEVIISMFKRVAIQQPDGTTTYEDQLMNQALGTSTNEFLTNDRNNHRVMDGFGKTKAYSKAERNALKKLLPSFDIEHMINTATGGNLKTLQVVESGGTGAAPKQHLTTPAPAATETKASPPTTNLPKLDLKNGMKKDVVGKCPLCNTTLVCEMTDYKGKFPDKLQWRNLADKKPHKQQVDGNWVCRMDDSANEAPATQGTLEPPKPVPTPPKPAEAKPAEPAPPPEPARAPYDGVTDFPRDCKENTDRWIYVKLINEFHMRAPDMKNLTNDDRRKLLTELSAKATKAGETGESVVSSDTHWQADSPAPQASEPPDSLKGSARTMWKELVSKYAIDPTKIPLDTADLVDFYDRVVLEGKQHKERPTPEEYAKVMEPSKKVSKDHAIWIMKDMERLEYRGGWVPECDTLLKLWEQQTNSVCCACPTYKEDGHGRCSTCKLFKREMPPLTKASGGSV